MARKVKRVDLSSRSARAKLKRRDKPYWDPIDEGLHQGYARRLHFGKWNWRIYKGGGQYDRMTLPGVADDVQPADGAHVLNFYQARRKIIELAALYRAPKAGETLFTVKDAIDAYLKDHTGADQRSCFRRHILCHKIAERPLAALQEAALAAWVKDLPSGLKRATKIRVTTNFKACLNSAWELHRKELPPDFEQIVRHGLVIKERAQSGARECQVLPDADIRRLLDAASRVDEQSGWGGAFYTLLLAMAATGARFSQIVRCTVADLQFDRLMVPPSGKGTGTKAPRIGVPIGPDVAAALRQASVGRRGHERLFLRPAWAAAATPFPDKVPWKLSNEIRKPWLETRALAGIDPTAIPYALRHSSIVRGLRAGLPIRLVAALHDTSTKMIEAAYSRFIVDVMDEVAARAVIPLAPAPVSPLRVASNG